MATGDVRPLGRRQRDRVAAVVEAAERETGLDLCVYVGPTDGDPRGRAVSLFHEAGLDDREAVLVLVAPVEHRVEILTSPTARRRVPDEACADAVDAMVAELRSGRLESAITVGVGRVATAAGAGTARGDDEPDLPDLLG